MNEPPTPFFFSFPLHKLKNFIQKKRKKKKKMLVHGCSRVAQLTRANAHACRVIAASPQH